MSATGNGSGREGLLDDLRLVIKDAEDLLRSTGSRVDGGYQAARARFESTMSDARESLSGMEEQLVEGAREALDQADKYVRENPWQAIGIGAAVGLIAGLLLGRRD
ncbi:MAG TPA: DUF883 family protein [Noviherbaspirillum sp.]|nr:DUF883 family protein [Noviherbaspirillum sp.]